MVTRDLVAAIEEGSSVDIVVVDVVAFVATITRSQEEPANLRHKRTTKWLDRSGFGNKIRFTYGMQTIGKYIGIYFLEILFSILLFLLSVFRRVNQCGLSLKKGKVSRTRLVEQKNWNTETGKEAAGAATATAVVATVVATTAAGNLIVLTCSPG